MFWGNTKPSFIINMYVEFCSVFTAIILETKKFLVEECLVIDILIYLTVHIAQNLYEIHINTLRPRQDGCRFPDNIFNCIFFNENVLILKVRINNIPALVQIMAWHRPGDKSLSGPVMVSLLTHICVTQPQWVIQCSGTTSVRYRQ